MASLICKTDGLERFTKGVQYQIVNEHDFWNRITVIDDNGHKRTLSGEFLEDNFKRV